MRALGKNVLGSLRWYVDVDVEVAVEVDVEMDFEVEVGVAAGGEAPRLYSSSRLVLIFLGLLPSRSTVAQLPQRCCCS